VIYRRIVEAPGGTISAHNNDLNGTAFRFTGYGLERTLGE